MDESGHEKRTLEAELEVKRGQLRDYEGRIGRKYGHERYRSQLADLRDELKLGLSDGASEEAKGKVGELADRIRELRAANEVEAAPERTGVRKVVRAERPVTARIRERLGEVEPVVEAVATEVKPEEPIVAPSAEVITLPVPKPDDSGDAPAGLHEAFSSRVTRCR